MDKTEYEERVQETVKKVGLPWTCAGAGVAASNVIYIVVLWLITINLDAPDEAMEDGLIYLFAIPFLLFSAGFLVLGARLRGHFFRFGGWIPMPMPLLKDLKASGEVGKEVGRLAKEFYIGSMISCIPACAPGVMALTLALVQVFDSSITADTPLLIMMIIMWSASTAQLLRVMPTGGRLERYLLEEINRAEVG